MIPAAFCRIWQLGGNAGYGRAPWREPVLVRGQMSVLRTAGILEKKGISRVLLVCDEARCRTGGTDLLETALRGSHIAVTVFCDFPPEPTDEAVEAGVRAYQQGHCAAIIALGGGSVIDCAKAVGARIARPERPVAELRGIRRVRRAIPPLIAVPTTAGSGSEATAFSVITDPETGRKETIGDPVLMPDTAVLDPMLTVSLPPHLTAQCGMETLTHAVEAFISRDASDLEYDNAVLAVMRIMQYLLPAVNNGENAEARENLQLASFEAGTASSHGSLGYARALANVIGPLYDLSYGYTVAGLLPPLLRAYGKSVRKPLAYLAERCGIGKDGADEEERAEAFISRIEDMNRKLGIPDWFPGIRDADVPEIARLAMEEAHPYYPVPEIWNRKRFEEFIRSIM